MIVEKRRVRRRKIKESRESRIQTTEYVSNPPSPPFHPVFLLPPAFFTSRPTKPIFVIYGKRDNRKEEEWEEEESRENEKTREDIPVGPTCLFVLRVAVAALVVVRHRLGMRRLRPVALSPAPLGGGGAPVSRPSSYLRTRRSQQIKKYDSIYVVGTENLTVYFQARLLRSWCVLSVLRYAG